MVMVRVAGALVAVWMPKSSSLGEKTIRDWVVLKAGMVMVWVVALVALAACRIRVPGGVPVRAMLHSAAGARDWGQLVVMAKVVELRVRLLAWIAPRLRRVRLGAAS